MTIIQISRDIYVNLAQIVISSPDKNEVNGDIKIADTDFKYRLIYDYDGYSLLYSRFLLHLKIIPVT